MKPKSLITKLRTESLYKDKATLEIMDLCMEAAAAIERCPDVLMRDAAHLIGPRGRRRRWARQVNIPLPAGDVNDMQLCGLGVEY